MRVKRREPPVARVGPLLARALAEIEVVAAAAEEDPVVFATSHVRGTTDDGRLPVVLQAYPRPPERGEPWAQYRERTLERLAPVHKLLSGMAIEPLPLVAANAFQVNASTEQIGYMLEADPYLALIELDPLVQVTDMDDVSADIALDEHCVRHPELDGSGIRVACLDTGVDLQHPFLSVLDSETTCDEPPELPGSHGTHCAGSIASQDDVFGGVAPAVDLINVKVLRANGTGRHTFIAAGVDAALDREADVLSMSLGFNHLPTWSDGGHGWACPDGRCALCTAVNNAVQLDKVVVVVAAGNEHERADALRRMGGSAATSFDTELGCPGQAMEAITVGAVTKSDFMAAAFSSRGPTAYGAAKPDIVAPGVNITSTIPVPRNPMTDTFDSSSARGLWFGRKSGTSMATPIVAGAVALVIQKRLTQQDTWTPEDVRQTLFEQLVVPIEGDQNTLGRGRLDLTHL